jgi:hypothetical protein
VSPRSTFDEAYEIGMRMNRKNGRYGVYALDDLSYDRKTDPAPKATHLISEATWFHRRSLWADLICARHDCKVVCLLARPEYVWKIHHENSERVLTIPETMKDPNDFIELARYELMRWSYLVHADFQVDLDLEASLSRGEQRRKLLTPTRVVHIHDVDPDDPKVVYIGRKMRGVRTKAGIKDLPASIWANPYKIGDDGDRRDVISLYFIHIKHKILEEPETYRLSDLDGKLLACWCKHPGKDIPCHGDILVRLLREVRDHREIPF